MQCAAHRFKEPGHEAQTLLRIFVMRPDDEEVTLTLECISEGQAKYCMNFLLPQMTTNLVAPNNTHLLGRLGGAVL